MQANYFENQVFPSYDFNWCCRAGGGTMCPNNLGLKCQIFPNFVLTLGWPCQVRTKFGNKLWMITTMRMLESSKRLDMSDPHAYWSSSVARTSTSTWSLSNLDCYVLYSEKYIWQYLRNTSYEKSRLSNPSEITKLSGSPQKSQIVDNKCQHSFWKCILCMVKYLVPSSPIRT